MGLHGTELQTFFRNKCGIPGNKVKYYIRWLNRFLEYRNGNPDDICEHDLKTFGDDLEQKGYKDWVVKQAQEAVLLYIEKFLHEPIKRHLEGVKRRVKRMQPGDLTHLPCGYAPEEHLGDNILDPALLPAVSLQDCAIPNPAFTGQGNLEVINRAKPGSQSPPSGAISVIPTLLRVARKAWHLCTSRTHPLRTAAPSL